MTMGDLGTTVSSETVGSSGEDFPMDEPGAVKIVRHWFQHSPNLGVRLLRPWNGGIRGKSIITVAMTSC